MFSAESTNISLHMTAKKTGTSHLQRHVECGCATANSPGTSKQLLMSEFLSKPVLPNARSHVIEKCVDFCCEEIQPFQTVAGGGFIKLAQELINIGAAYGRLSAKKLLPDPTTISRRCQEKATTIRKAIVAEIKEVIRSVNVGMTTDMWTDDYRKVSYMAITCHLCNGRFQVEE